MFVFIRKYDPTSNGLYYRNYKFVIFSIPALQPGIASLRLYIPQKIYVNISFLKIIWR